MSYLRKKVAPIRPNPPSGTYPQPLTVYLHCDTHEVTMYYTLDGTVPVANSSRSHGFQSHTYNPISGISLKGGGSHSVTVVAIREGYLSPAMVKLKYVVQGSKLPRTPQALGDAIIERRFLAMAALDPPMPLRLARARTPDLKCALVDTMGKQELRRQRKEGQELALFQLTHNVRSVSRQDTYRRVVPPSLSVALPQLPNKQVTGGPTLSMRSSADDRFSLTTYERPDFDGTIGSAAVGLHRTMSRLSTTDKRNNSLNRSKTPGMQGKTLATTKGSIVAKNNESGYLERYNYKSAPRTVAQETSFTRQLAWFETRTGLVPKATDHFEDETEKQDAVDYAERVQSTMANEGERLQHSNMYSISVAPNQVSLGDDVAAECKDFMSCLLTAQQLCHSPLSRLLSIVPYNTIAPVLGRGTVFAAPDLAAISDGAFTVVEATKALKALGIMNPDRMVNTKLFLLLLRFLVWKARPVPEAVFGLAINYWKMATNDDPTTGDARVSQMEMNLLLDWYAKTRGCHEASLDKLKSHTNARSNLTRNQQAAADDKSAKDKVSAVVVEAGAGVAPAEEEGLDAAAVATGTASERCAWLDFTSDSDGKIPYTNLFQVFATMTPMIDAALVDMNSATHPMYAQPLALWGH